MNLFFNFIFTIPHEPKSMTKNYINMTKNVIFCKLHIPVIIKCINVWLEMAHNECEINLCQK